MINRIILIGNGFDLAHGLLTGYNDFITNYWVNWAKKLTQSSRQIEEDELCYFKLETEYFHPDYISNIKKFIDEFSTEPLTENCLDEISKLNNKNLCDYKLHHRYKSEFFREINKAIESKKWVDVEYEYYQILKNIADNKTTYSAPIELDREFEILKTKLQKYLSDIQKELIKPELVKDCIQNSIYELVKAEDISLYGKGLFEDSIENRLSEIQDTKGACIKSLLKKYGISYSEYKSDIESYLKKITDPDSISPDWDDIYYDSEKHKQNITNGNVPDYFLLPDHILLLNFNYTSTADLYIPKGSEFKVNHIHGELGNDKNPIIFGYGDELDEDYKKISNLNDNEYLGNIKSMRYLETDNYRNLLSFIDSAPFQIYIMGHSCGNSDRTLLNTLFEHKNCVSIKPFYHQKDDGTDNYIEIIQNISRNFNDMRLMRDRVVNKTYCRPLVQKQE